MMKRSAHKELKATSAYLLECQVEANSQLFKAHYRNVVKNRAEILKHPTMLNGTSAAAWRIRHEIIGDCKTSRKVNIYCLLQT